jgi:acyl carrier protein
MNKKPAPDEVRQTVMRILGDIAPEADLQALKADISFRDQLDIDSMDFVNFIIALHRELSIEIPEPDYPK